MEFLYQIQEIPLEKIMKIEIRELSFAYKKGKKIIDNLDLCVENGDIVAIIGENGSGKTTLLKLIGGLLEQDSGEIIIGFDNSKQKPKYSGIIENPHFWNDLSGRENLFYFLADYYDNKKVDLAFDKWKLKEAADKAVRTYSLGMRQKLALMIAFLSESEILLLDEPTVALDAESIKIFYECVREASQNNRIIILATHIMYNLEENCNMIYSLKDGKLDTEKDVNSRVNYYVISFKTADAATLASTNLHKDEVCSLNGMDLVVADSVDSISDIIRRIDEFDILSVRKKGINE